LFHFLSLHRGGCFTSCLSTVVVVSLPVSPPWWSFHFLSLPPTENMAVDSMLPSPSSLSSPMLGIEGLSGRRRKKRTSIETNVRVALERNFHMVGEHRKWRGHGCT